MTTPSSEITLLCDGCPATVRITAIPAAAPDAERVQVQCPACGAVVHDTSATVLTVSLV